MSQEQADKSPFRLDVSQPLAPVSSLAEANAANWRAFYEAIRDRLAADPKGIPPEDLSHVKTRTFGPRDSLRLADLKSRVEASFPRDRKDRAASDTAAADGDRTGAGEAAADQDPTRAGALRDAAVRDPSTTSADGDVKPGGAEDVRFFLGRPPPASPKKNRTRRATSE